MNHINTSHRSGQSKPGALDERLLAMNNEAMRFVSPGKLEHQVRQWLSGVPWTVHEGHWKTALMLATELAFITPSMLGATAFDRLLRSRKDWPHADLAALALLRRGRPCLARLSGELFEDLATGETRRLVPSAPAQDAGDGEVFGRFAVTAEGAIAVGNLLALDEESLAVAEGFIRPGRRGLSNPVRCTEAIYRHWVRHGMAASEPPAAKLPFDPEHNLLDALAADWAAIDAEPTPQERARVAPLVGTARLVDALISVAIARDGGATRLATAYRRIAAQMIEFIAAREAYGSGRFSLDRVAAELDTANAGGRYARETKALFEDLRERARLAANRKTDADGDLDKLVQRIRALRAKTVEQGCTEQEALAAAEKVAELLDRYGLSLSELDLRKQQCEGIGVDTGRKRRAPIDDCIATIAGFFDCRVWAETAESGEIRHIFFGLPADVQAALYLHDLVVLAFATETMTFQRAEFYQSLDSGGRRSATNSFQVGLAHGIIEKLSASRRARDAGMNASGGRALVPVKQSIIDEEMERLGLTLRSAIAPRRRVISDAFGAGREAGKKFEYRPGIEAA